MAKVVTRVEPDFVRQAYIFEVVRGVALTSRVFVRNLFGRHDTQTVQYPEVRKPYPSRFRGRHRLMKRDDGQVRCVACMLCATACPANCISITAMEHEDRTIEKTAASFEIDLLKCIYCGFCAEACPSDAIRMDSGRHTLPAYDRRSERMGKIDLMAIGEPSAAIQGGRFGADPDAKEHH